MIPFELQTYGEMARSLGERVKALRLDRGWTQQELAERAGLSLETFRVFERTGQISLERLLKLAVVLDALSGIEQLFQRARVNSLAELEATENHPKRKRGRRQHAQA